MSIERNIIVKSFFEVETFFLSWIANLAWNFH